MFDTIIPNQDKPIHCPLCQRVLNNFQTKDVVSLMNEYREGETESTHYGYKQGEIETSAGKLKWPEIDLNDVRKTPHPIYQQVYGYEWCDHCTKMIGQYFRFNEIGLLTRHGDTIIEP